MEEIEDLVRPNRAVTAQEFLAKAIPSVMSALEKQEWVSFREGFLNMGSACMHCPTQNDHAFIVLPRDPATATSPVLNLSPQAR